MSLLGYSDLFYSLSVATAIALGWLTFVLCQIGTQRSTGTITIPLIVVTTLIVGMFIATPHMSKPIEHVDYQTYQSIPKQNGVIYFEPTKRHIGFEAAGKFTVTIYPKQASVPVATAATPVNEVESGSKWSEITFAINNKIMLLLALLAALFVGMMLGLITRYNKYKEKDAQKPVSKAPHQTMPTAPHPGLMPSPSTANMTEPAFRIIS